MKELEKIKDMFNTTGSGMTHCFSLVCWTDGFWSVNVTDDWHKWSENNIPNLEFRFPTPQMAVTAFLKHIKKNNINLKELQENE